MPDSSGIRIGQANEHLAALGTVVVDALVGAGAAVEGITGVENGLAVVSGKGHLTADYVINRLQGVVAKLAAAAGEEMGQADDQLAVIDVIRIVETGGEHVVVAGGLISISVSLAYDLVAHLEKLPFYCLVRTLSDLTNTY